MSSITRRSLIGKSCSITPKHSEAESLWHRRKSVCFWQTSTVLLWTVKSRLQHVRRPPKANKGSVVEMLSEFLKIPSAEIVTIGDMPNDVFMFKKSGYSIAMGQASEEVKKSATYVTAGMDEEGFAKAVEQFVLK